MNSIEEMRGRCHVCKDTGCWLWRGAFVADMAGQKVYPRIYTANYTKDPSGATKSVQPGGRAAWHAYTCKPIPAKHRVFKTCKETMCINPAHSQCIPTAQRGAKIAELGLWKNSAKRIESRQRYGRKQSRITPEILQMLLTSPATSTALAKELGLAKSTVCKARKGEIKSIARVANPFAGLGAR
jgi:hypothetical protein